MPSIPELVIIDLFNSLVDRIKQSKPSTTTGKPLGGDIVYSQLLLGMPIDPEDYARPWSPIGGASQATSAPQAAAGVPALAGQPPPALLKALEAAFHTSQIANLMLQVTDDGSYLEYPVGRHLSFQYTGIVDAMTPVPSPPLPPAEQAALDAATKVLYILDTTDPANPVIVDKTDLYKTYQKNAKAYANAKANYAVNQAMTLADPAKQNLWPQISATYQTAVDDAWDDFRTEGADKIEPALALYESQGINLQQAQIAAAKKQLDIWSLGLAGVPTNIPYSYVDPSEWCDPDNDDIGFEQLQIKRTSEEHLATSVTDNNSSMWWNNSTHAMSQSSHAGFSVFGIGGSGAENSSNADQHAAHSNASAYTFTKLTTDHFTDFEINIEWGLVTLYRPWLISDLFYMNNWYIPQERTNCISDGKIQTQLRSNAPMLPMIPQQMLVVRNVSIKSSSWGDTGNVLNTLYNGDSGQTNANQNSAGGSGGASYGPINCGSSVQSANTSAAGKGATYNNANAMSRNSASFDGTTLTINGCQVIAFVSDIVPPTPNMDDPALPKPKSNANANANTIAGPAPAPAQAS
jgi:hypothetical protein